jgi:glutathione S-transferase
MNPMTLQLYANYANLRVYRARLLARSSVERAVAEARPFRQHVPLGAPDRH